MFINMITSGRWRLNILICCVMLLVTCIKCFSGHYHANNVQQPTSAANHMSAERLPTPSDRVKNEPASVWVEFTKLGKDKEILNLGQGFPDYAAPDYLIDALHNATNQKPGDQDSYLNNQYTRPFGHPRLVKALLSYYHDSRDFLDLEDSSKQILITVGAYEALYCSVMAFVNPGDEVIIIDPAFDAYEPMVRAAGGNPVFVPLVLTRPNQWGNQRERSLNSADYKLDMNKLRSVINNHTRALILNTPNNPLGKVFTREELKEISQICISKNILVIADEVYEQMYYDDNQHVSIGSLPGMSDRTITIGSAGKTFSVTGWKLGWAFGPEHLIRYVQLQHQTTVYTVATPLQEAAARMLEHEILETKGNNKPTFWSQLRTDLLEKRNRMAEILIRANMIPVIPQGGYFMLADFSSMAQRFPEYEEIGRTTDASSPDTKDYRFARWLSTRKLLGIPASAFYSAGSKQLAENMIRFCFIKRDAAFERMEKILGELGGARSKK